MPSLTPAAHFSEVIHDFLSSATAIAAGAPALASLQRRHLGSTDPITHPSLLIDADADPDNTDDFITINLRLVLTAQIGTETGHTTRDAAHELLQDCRALLADTDTARATWNTWIALQTDNYKSGWSIQQLWSQATTSELNPEKSLLTLTAPYQLTAFWNS